MSRAKEGSIESDQLEFSRRRTHALPVTRLIFTISSLCQLEEEDLLSMSGG